VHSHIQIGFGINHCSAKVCQSKDEHSTAEPSKLHLPCGSKSARREVRGQEAYEGNENYVEQAEQPGWMVNAADMENLNEQ